jgi:hypothetical protein
MDINLLLRGGSLNQLLGRLLPEQQLVRDLLNSLRPGQVLLAKVLAQPRPDIARLLIQDVPVSARTNRPLPLGSTVQLTVIKGGETPELRVHDPQRPPTAQDVLRVALPRQIPLGESITGLRDLAPRLMPVLSGAARDILKTLLETTPPARQLTAERLQQQVRESGLFTEARMARGLPPESGDRKALLMRLAAALPQRPGASNSTGTTTTAGSSIGTTAAAGSTGSSHAAGQLSRALLLGSAVENLKAVASQSQPANTQLTPEQLAIQRLWRLIEGSIARIQTQQAASLPADNDSRPAFQLEIPVALPGGELQALELRIEQETPKEGEEQEAAEAGWLVTIGFHFDQMGPVKAGVRLADGRIFTTFWCERTEAVARFDRMLPELRRNLEAAGLEVGNLAASQGTPPVSNASQRPRSQLLDERV